MAWTALDRQKPVFESKGPALLPKAVQDKIRAFFPRYETKRAVLLPALHIVQHTLGYIPPQAMVEIAQILEIHPSDVLDTISFYTHFWTHPKGKKVITVCRSISCEVMGGASVLEELKKQLKIQEHGTTTDGKYSLVTEECLAGCDHAPCMLVNEKLHKRVKTSEVAKILADAANDAIDFPRSDLFDPPVETSAAVTNGNGKRELIEVPLETTSDVREMREAD